VEKPSLSRQADKVFALTYQLYDLGQKLPLRVKKTPYRILIRHSDAATSFKGDCYSPLEGNMRIAVHGSARMTAKFNFGKGLETSYFLSISQKRGRQKIAGSLDGDHRTAYPVLVHCGRITLVNKNVPGAIGKAEKVLKIALPQLRGLKRDVTRTIDTARKKSTEKKRLKTSLITVRVPFGLNPFITAFYETIHIS
jgi:hypothetical protein